MLQGAVDQIVLIVATVQLIFVYKVIHQIVLLFNRGSQYKLVLATPKNLINPIPEGQNGIYLDYVMIIGKSFHHFDGYPLAGCAGYSWNTK